MSSFFTEAMSALSGADFDEVPVPIEEFVTSPKYLKLKPLSEYQYQIIRAASQIYRLDTLIALYGEDAGRKRYEETYNEVVLMLGKGSGKDYCSTIAVAYIVYLLLCLKDPATYYGLNEGEPIDIINVAINAEQARTVFFNRFVDRIKRCPWFIGKFKPGNNVIEFDKNVNAFSGHSEREAFEGKNLIVAVLDEISAFALESNTGNSLADTAHATYQMYQASVTSRYPDFGKVVLLSFPRFFGDYISQRYGGFDDPDKGIIGAIANNGEAREVIIREHTFKLNNDLPDGIEGNEFTIQWEEDHIERYSFDRIFALRRPSWEVNPLRTIEDYKREFFTNKADALGRYACMPSDNTDDTFFKNKEAIESSFMVENGVDNDGIFHPSFKPKSNAEYFIHVDLSKVHDRCAIALAHVDKWVERTMLGERSSQPVVRVDAIRWWKPSKAQPMDYNAVTDFILNLKARGFNIKLVTFDRWNSHDTIKYLQDRHMEVEMLSLKTSHYDDFLTVMYDNRLEGPNLRELKDELRQLRYIKDKVDHPRAGYKDLSDAVCGAIFNAVSRTRKPQEREIEVETYASLARADRQAEIDAARADVRGGIIHAPKMPDDLRSGFRDVSLERIRLL